MATKRRVRTRIYKPEDISPTAWHIMSDGLYPAPEEGLDEWEALLDLDPEREKCRELWGRARDVILGDWISKRPGTRPSCWWDYDAPEPERRRLGGIGTPNHEALAYEPAFYLGIPSSGWVSKFDEAYYNGRARDIHGNPIGTEHKEGDFTGKAIDRENPPKFESQAAYLKRHNLLDPAEESRLRASDFKPEAVLPDAEGGNDPS